MSGKETEAKRNGEKETLRVMCGIYCRGRHKRKGGLCEDCQSLLDYALYRTEKCPFMETKTFCSACKVHCYSEKRQEQIRQVMRYAGPRMLFVNPALTVKHMKTTWKSKRQAKRQQETG